MIPAQNSFILNGIQLVFYHFVQLLAHTGSWRFALNNKIKLSFIAALEGGAVNKLCVSFLARILKVSQSKISIQPRIKNCSKVFRVANIYSTCWESVIQPLQNTH